MMYPDCFLKYYDYQSQLIVKYYNILNKYDNIEAIHDIRVAIKRMRAQFNLTENLVPDFNAKKTYKQIRKLFKAAGSVRDCQVQLQILNKHIAESNLILDEYYNFIKAEELAARKGYQKIAGRFDIGILDVNRGILEEVLKPFEQARFENNIIIVFGNMLREFLIYRGKEPFKDSDFHKIRIKSKETRYYLEILQQCLNKSDFFRSLNDALRNVHRALGGWHDMEVTLEQLDSFLRSEIQGQLRDESSYQKFNSVLTELKNSYIEEFESRWKELNEVLAGYNFETKNQGT